ncbi:hypothetical protein [Mesorhizobium sp. 128a]
MADDNKPTIVPMQPKNEMRAAGDSLRRQLPEMIANVQAIAKLRRAAYLAYIEEGFTEDQALQLCSR